MNSIARSIFMIVAFAALSLARADPGEGGSYAQTKDPVLAQVVEASRAKDWPRAAGILREALAKSPANADYHNLYAFSLRKGPNPDMKLVFKHYEEALRIDPKHRGAHEYVGEAYLMVGDLAKAREHLKVLDRLCFFPCAEYSDLKKAIAEHELGTRR
jgi:tetratricopeptide (TPR) repeat protein